MKADMQTLLVSDLDPTLDDAAVLGACITVYTSPRMPNGSGARPSPAAPGTCSRPSNNSVSEEYIGSTQQVAERIVHVAAADKRTLMLPPLGIYESRYPPALQFLGGDATDVQTHRLHPAVHRRRDISKRSRKAMAGQ